MPWYPEYKKPRGMTVTVPKIVVSQDWKPMTAEEFEAAVASDRLYPSGHPVTLARFRRAKDAELHGSTALASATDAPAIIQDSLKPYNCPALGVRISSRSQIKRELRQHYEKTGVRLREFT